MKTKYVLIMFFLCCMGVGAGAAAELPDFTVSDIMVVEDPFIHIQLRNLSNVDVRVTPDQMEKIFLVIYIDNVLRAEYKLKYMDEKLLHKESVVVFRTNFRITKGTALTIKAGVNLLEVIPESNFSNNTLEKRLVEPHDGK